VLVWKIDRFGRSRKHLVNALADRDSYCVAFVSLKDKFDLSTPSRHRIGRPFVCTHEKWNNDCSFGARQPEEQFDAVDQDSEGLVF
jgi:hypothetical protein